MREKLKKPKIEYFPNKIRILKKTIDNVISVKTFINQRFFVAIIQQNSIKL